MKQGLWWELWMLSLETPSLTAVQHLAAKHFFWHLK
jgi:hypothetical protein